MGLGMLAIMGLFVCVVFLVGIASGTRENTFSKRKRKIDPYDGEEDYFFSDEKPKHGSEFVLSDDGELLPVEEHDQSLRQF
jgi:hypothetical protein